VLFATMAWERTSRTEVLSAFACRDSSHGVLLWSIVGEKDGLACASCPQRVRVAFGNMIIHTRHHDRRLGSLDLLFGRHAAASSKERRR
jgi:hypothetical protein